MIKIIITNDQALEKNWRIGAVTGSVLFKIKNANICKVGNVNDGYKLKQFLPRFVNIL